MKKGMNALIITWLLLGQAAIASEEQVDRQGLGGGIYTREELKAALMILLKSGALTLPDTENQYPKVDSQLLKELRAEGLIQNSRPELAVVCTDIIE